MHFTEAANEAGKVHRLVSRFVPRLVPRLVSRLISRLVSRLVPAGTMGQAVVAGAGFISAITS